MTHIPSRIADVAELEELLSDPTPGVIATMSKLLGDIVVLGAGGKMGPTLARMAKRASVQAGSSRRVIAVSRFTQGKLRHDLEQAGVETISCDLLDPGSLKELPEAENIVFMAGMKFGASNNAALTWAMNVDLPAMVCRRYAGSRFVAFSTGNVYPLAPVTSGGSLETDDPGPVGEYAMSCLGRERVFEHYAAMHNNPVSIIRLSYAVEMRYGVLLDTALKVFRGEPVDLNMGNMMAIWQGDANAQSLQAFEHASTTPNIINITGPELLSVKQVAIRFASIFGKPVTYHGEERGIALLSCTQKAQKLFGYPTVTIDRVMELTADWVSRGGTTLNKPTHFETTDGKF